MARRCSAGSCRTSASGRRREPPPPPAAPIALPHKPVPRHRRRPRVRRRPRAAGRPRRGRQHPRCEHGLGGVGCRCRSPTRRVRSGTARATSSRRRLRCRPRSPEAGCGHGPSRRSAACAPRPAAAPGWNTRASSPATPSRTSTRRWVPSTPPRGVVLGHSPSCSPAMTTTSHSLPSAACALSTVTPSVSGAGSPAAGNGPSVFTCSTRPRSDAPAVRDTYCSVTSKRAVTASRSLSAFAPIVPPRSLAASQRRCRPERCHACHSV